MASGIWTSAAAAAAQTQRVETIANNLANADTLAFKKDQDAFREYLAIQEREPANLDVKRGPIKDKEFYPLDGRDQAYVVTDGTYTNFKQGGLRVTKSPLDVALDGPGMIEISTPNGTRFTRAGSLKLAMDGRLVTTEGHPVLSAQPGGLAGARSLDGSQLGQGGPSTQGGVGAGNQSGRNPADVARYISLKDKTNVTISQSGDIYAGDELIAKLSLVEFQDLNKLRKTGGGLYECKDAANIQPPNGRTVVHQGMVETSNVNPIQEMTDLIKANRLFEQDMKAMKTYGELMSREANDIGKL